MFTRTLLACAFTMSCFMGLQATEQEKDSPAVEFCEKNKDNSSLLAGCCKGKCNKKRKRSKKKHSSSAMACKRRDHKKKEQVVELACKNGKMKKDEVPGPKPLFECKDC